MMYVRFPLILRNVEDFPAERGIYICHVTVGQRQRPLQLSVTQGMSE